MKYRITWFNKGNGLVHSEGQYEIDEDVASYYLDEYNLMKGDGCCILVDPDHFPHSGHQPLVKNDQ